MKNCNQCGKCCLKYGGNGDLSATNEEIEWWQSHRPNIARYVQDGQIWIDPETGTHFSGCPWLRKVPGEEIYTCDIYFDRPEDCREYPSLVSEMIDDGCDMIEVTDLQNLTKAQARLNQLMDRK